MTKVVKWSCDFLCSLSPICWLVDNLEGKLKFMIKEKQKRRETWVPESLSGGEDIRSTINPHRTWSGLEINLLCAIKPLRFQGLFVTAAKTNLPWLIHRLACPSCTMAFSAHRPFLLGEGGLFRFWETLPEQMGGAISAGCGTVF